MAGLDDILQQFLSSQQPTQSPVAQRMATAMPPSLTQDEGPAQAPTPQAQPQPQRMAAPPPKVTAQPQQPKPPDDLKINVSGGVKSYLPYIVPLLGGVVSAMSPAGARGVHGAAAGLSALGQFQNRDAQQALRLAQFYQRVNQQQQTSDYQKARLDQGERRLADTESKSNEPKMSYDAYQMGIKLGFPKGWDKAPTSQQIAAVQDAQDARKEQAKETTRIFTINNPMPSRAGGGGKPGDLGSLLQDVHDNTALNDQQKKILTHLAASDPKKFTAAMSNLAGFDFKKSAADQKQVTAEYNAAAGKFYSRIDMQQKLANMPDGPEKDKFIDEGIQKEMTRSEKKTGQTTKPAAPTADNPLGLNIQ